MRVLKDDGMWCINFDTEEVPCFCGMEVVNDFHAMKLFGNEIRQPLDPMTELLDEVVGRNAVLLADKKGGVADLHIFPLIPLTPFVARGRTYQATFSPYFLNTNSGNQVRYCTICPISDPEFSGDDGEEFDEGDR